MTSTHVVEGALGKYLRTDRDNTDRNNLDDLHEKGFTHSVKRARTLVEESMVKRSMGNNAAGAIFVLKNMGYSDRHSVQVDPIKIVISGVDAQF